jgi:SAM-dependent methyltransferase
MSDQYIHFGCGLSAPATWRNFDVSLTMRLQKTPFVGQLFKRNGLPIFPENIEYGDIVRGLPIGENTAKAIYCSHVLEHLALSEFRVALQNVYRYLQPDGVFRLVMPDLEYSIQQYTANPDARAAHEFLQSTGLGRRQRRKDPVGLLRTLLGGSEHMWLWDYKAVEVELKQVGFKEVRRAYFNDSQEERFKDVEEYGRWENCLGVECKK